MDGRYQLLSYCNTNVDKWNSFYSNDTIPKKKIWYLPQINLSTTSGAVVIETLKRAHKMASEFQRNTIPVT